MNSSCGESESGTARQSINKFDSLPGQNFALNGKNMTRHDVMTVDTPSGRSVMQDGQKFNNTLRNNGQHTAWTKCDARWSEIQQHLAKQ